MAGSYRVVRPAGQPAVSGDTEAELADALMRSDACGVDHYEVERVGPPDKDGNPTGYRQWGYAIKDKDGNVRIVPYSGG